MQRRSGKKLERRNDAAGLLIDWIVTELQYSGVCVCVCVQALCGPRYPTAVIQPSCVNDLIYDYRDARCVHDKLSCTRLRSYTMVYRNMAAVTKFVAKIVTRSIWKMLGPFATASRRTPLLHCHSPCVATVARRLRYRCPQQRQRVTEGTAIAP